MKFIDVVTSTRQQASIPVANIVAIYDFQGYYSKIQTKDGAIYYCDMSRKKLIEMLGTE